MNEQLANLIETTPALTAFAEADDDAGLLAALNAQDRQRENHELQTINAIVLALGAQAAAVTVGVLKAAAAANPLLDAVYIKLCSTGVDLADPLTQAMIAQIFTGEYADLGAAVAALGVWQESTAQQQFGREVTAEEVTEALAILARRNLQRRLAARYSAVSALILSGDVETWEAAVEALDDEGE